MRTSISLLLAFIVSFSLLLLMAGLVNQPHSISSPRALVFDDMPVPSKAITRETKTQRQLPDQQKTAVIPRGLPPADGETDGPTITRGIPRGDPNIDKTEWLTPTKWNDPPTTTDGNRPGTEKGLVPISQIQPLYPREQALRGIEGWVTLRFEVRQDGSVGNVNVVKAAPRGAFDEAARQAVQRWRYKPTEQGPMVQTVTLDFTLEN